jgi:ethanolamine utilization protein EutA (predicted chaperonin)
MQENNSNYKEITSVGIDVGTSTTHLVFSQLILKEDPLSKTRKYVISKEKSCIDHPYILLPCQIFKL